MPIYEYRCERGHTFEVLQRMSEDPVTACATCDAEVQRVLHPVAVHFKGSGFYTTDYGKKGRSAGGEGGEANKNGADSADSPSAKGEASSDGKKSSAGSSTGSGAGSTSSSD